MTEYEKAYGKGSFNQFSAHAYDVVIVLEKAVPLALKIVGSEWQVVPN